MRHRRAASAATPLLAALALTLAACGGDDDDAPGSDTTPPGAGALPPSLIDCFADEGFDLESPNEIHSAPPDVVQRCFTALHESGG